MSGNVVSDELPTGKRHLGVAVALVFLFIALCLLGDWWLIQKTIRLSTLNQQDTWITYIGTLRSILENLIASALAVLLLGLMYRFVVSWIDPADRVVEISAVQITNRLLANAKKSQAYLFLGNTATFVTTAVVPVLADAGRAVSRPRTITLFLIDPLDQTTVKNYCEYSDRVSQEATKVSDAVLATWIRPTSQGKTQSESEVAGKILASIYLIAFGACKQNISAAVYLRKSFTPFRVDLSDSEAVVTQESASQSAVAFSARGHFYSWYLKESEALRSQCIHLDLTSVRSQMRQDLTDPSSSKEEILVALKKLLSLFSYLQPLLQNSIALDAAVTRISNPTHAYK